MFASKPTARLALSLTVAITSLALLCTGARNVHDSLLTASRGADKSNWNVGCATCR